MSFIQAKPRATHDFYAPIHKGIRLGLCQMLTRLGAADAGDADLPQLLADLRAQLRLSEQHLVHEDAVIHTALEARAPGSTSRLAQAHEHHRATFEDIETLVCRIEHAEGPAKTPLLRALYLRFSLFAADDFAHMAEEEQLMLPILQSLFSDEELMALEDAIVSQIPPEEMVAVASLMIAAATRTDRIGMLSAMRANAPAEAFGAILSVAVRPNISADDFAHLSEGLGLAA